MAKDFDPGDDIDDFREYMINNNSEIRILTPEEFLNHLYAVGDFSEFGRYKVLERIKLPSIDYKHKINLGKGIFAEGFDCAVANFLNDFNCGKSIFVNCFSCEVANFISFTCARAIYLNGFDCGFATFKGPFDCDEAIFCNFFLCCEATFKESFHCSWSIFKEYFHCGIATFFGKFYCASAQFNGIFICAQPTFYKNFNCDYAKFKKVDATNNYALGMVIHHYKLSGVSFSIKHFSSPQEKITPEKRPAEKKGIPTDENFRKTLLKRFSKNTKEEK